MKAAVWICAALLAAPLVGQSPSKEVARLAKELRAPKLNAAQREDIVFQLLDYEQEGAQALKDVAERELSKLRRRYDKDRAKHLKAFEEAARELMRERRADKQTKLLRAEILLLSRDDGLTKEMVREEIDPRFERLQTMLQVSVEGVLENEPKLRRDVSSLAETDQQLLVWDEIERQAVAALSMEPITATSFETVAQARERLVGFESSLELDDLQAIRFNRTQADEIDAESMVSVVQLNQIRVVVGLPALRIDPQLCAAAQGHCEDMRELGFFAHESPIEGRRTPYDRAILAGTTSMAENIAKGQLTGSHVLEGWWYSPGHHRNLMCEATRIGMGHSDDIWTQLFGR